MPKPDPEPYLVAAAALGVAPAECVAVEDSPAGLTSARLAGCRVVAVGGPTAVGRPDLVVSGLTEVDLGLLGSLYGGGPAAAS
jgi:beta-phosphoglucomutase-like phosphatase (HAD superfamily)